MKNISLYIIILVVSFFSANMSIAQQKEYKGKMSVTPLKLKQVGDSLYIGIDFDIKGVNVDSRRSISLIPVLIAPGMERRLPEVMVKGRANFLTSKREIALMSKSERSRYEQNLPYAIVKGYKSNELKRVEYRMVLPFEEWMREARLDIQEDLCGCGNPPRSLAVAQLVNNVQLERIIEPYEVTPYLAYVQPAAEAVKKREMVGEAFLDFIVSRIDIRPDYMNNPRELKKITDMMEEVRTDAAITVKGISVEGYASPEGTLSHNKILSEGRAKALVNYLLPRFNYPKGMYRVAFGGENWDGLLAIVEASDMQYRDDVIKVLKTIPAEIDYKTNTSRKKALMELKGGAAYKFMLKEYYPSLRKAICKIDYEVKGFNVVEAKTVFKSRPQNLSLNEMYLVANTYGIGSQEFVDVFETAVRLFPNDVTANMNAASAALVRHDVVSAERYLKKIEGKSSDAEYHNALGVLMMFKGEFDRAKEELTKAADAGLSVAKSNLEELAKKRENAELLKKQNKK